MKRRYTIGIDEAGRGPWAGPLAAAAVLLPDDTEIEGLGDSKRLSARKRRDLSRIIAEYSHGIGLGWASAREIDRLGLSSATALAMQRAYRQLPKLRCEVVVDGAINYLSGTPHTRSQVRADADIATVSAASIVAKHYRDLYMTQAAVLYPEYGFERHAGYGTAVHRRALQSFGICALHRLSFAPVRAVAG